MTYDPDRHDRRSIRLKTFDYAQAGAYLVTVVARDRACLFGRVIDGGMRLSDGGLAVEACWLAIPAHFPFVQLDAHVVMPNHVHGIIIITSHGTGVGADRGGANVPVVGANNHSPLPRRFRSPSKTVGSVVRGFKIGVTKWFRAHTDVQRVWQRNYHEHVIRDEPSWRRIRDYIAANPARWAADADYHRTSRQSPS